MDDKNIELSKEEQKQLDDLSASNVLRVNPKIFRPALVRRAKKIYKKEPEISLPRLLKDVYKSAVKEDKKLVYQGMGWSVAKGVTVGMLPMLMGNMTTALQNTAEIGRLWMWGSGYVGGMAVNSVAQTRAAVLKIK